jgi:hypothetical protein
VVPKEEEQIFPVCPGLPKYSDSSAYSREPSWLPQPVVGAFSGSQSPFGSPNTMLTWAVNFTLPYIRYLWRTYYVLSAGKRAENGNHYLAEKTEKKHKPSQAPVAHACNPSYSGDRDQEDLSSKPARANSWRDPISKIPNTK